MAMRNPAGRANYQPNSWDEGPRESPELGFRSFPAEEAGPKQRIRAASFADHYSQARQFYISQMPVEQAHIAAALTFELSKVETPVIRERMVAHLLNIDQGLAKSVAQALGLDGLPKPAPAAIAPRRDLEPSPALSIIGNGPQRFEGRKLGILVTDGVDAAVLKGLIKALKSEKAVHEIVAPKVGGVTASDGGKIAADQMLAGGPSVLYDAVALLPSEAGVKALLSDPAARDFVADAFAHGKFIGHGPAARPLFDRAGIADDLDDGVIEIAGGRGAAAFVAALGRLRYWEREG